MSLNEETTEELLARFAEGRLPKEERRRLFEGALHDQALFDALADEDALRDLLADDHAREAVLARLRRPSRRAGLRWMSSWRAPLALAASLALVAVAASVMLRRPPAPGDEPVSKGMGVTLEELGEDGTPAEAAVWPELSRAPAASPALARLVVHPLEPRIGDELRLELTVNRDASVLVLVERPSRGTIRVFPDRDTRSADLREGASMRIPGSSGPLLASEPVGGHRVRAFLLPPGTDPRDPSRLREALAAGRVTGVTLDYEVVH